MGETEREDDTWTACQPGEIRRIAASAHRRRQVRLAARSAGLIVLLAVGVVGTGFLTSTSRNEQETSNPTYAGIRCSEVFEQMDAYRAGHVDDETAARIDSHLTDCEHCRAELERREDDAAAQLQVSRTDILAWLDGRPDAIVVQR